MRSAYSIAILVIPISHLSLTDAQRSQNAKTTSLAVSVSLMTTSEVFVLFGRMYNETETHKVVVFGAGGVGKTSTITRYVNGYFGDDYDSGCFEDDYRLFAIIEGKILSASISYTIGFLKNKL